MFKFVIDIDMVLKPIISNCLIQIGKWVSYNPQKYAQHFVILGTVLTVVYDLFYEHFSSSTGSIIGYLIVLLCWGYNNYPYYRYSEKEHEDDLEGLSLRLSSINIFLFGTLTCLLLFSFTNNFKDFLSIAYLVIITNGTISSLNYISVIMSQTPPQIKEQRFVYESSFA